MWVWFLRAVASSKEQESFWRGWEGEKSSVPVTQHHMAFSKINASSTWGKGHDGYNNIRSISFPWHMLLAHFFNNLHSLFSHLLTFWFHHYRELCSSLYTDRTLFQTMLTWNGETKSVKWEKRPHSFVLTSDYASTMDCQLPVQRVDAAWCGTESVGEAPTLIPVN